MDWCEDLLERLSENPCCGYGCADSPATEPAALAAMALATAGRVEPARQVADWLAAIQSTEGSVGVRATESEPRWPTSLALLTWATMEERDDSVSYQDCIDRAANWIVSHQGRSLPSTNEAGHDATLPAWPWADNTHSWVEPTALHVLALKAVGQSSHPRVRDAIRMLVNRQLVRGGFNYGNTVVLGNPLRPDLQPTGLALLALAEEPDIAARLSLSLTYLRRELTPTTATASLCWSLLGLQVHGVHLNQAERWLEGAYRRVVARGASPHKLALIALAWQQDQSPLIRLPKNPARTIELAKAVRRHSGATQLHAP